MRCSRAVIAQRTFSPAAGGSRVYRHRRLTVASAMAKQVQPVNDAWEKLQGTKVYRSSDGAHLDITSLWGPQDRAVVAFARELAIQLRRDLKPALDAAGVKLFLVSIGTWQRSIEFAEVTGFPREALLADPTSETYAALGLVKSVRATFFGAETAFSFLRRMRDPSGSGLADLKDVMGRWKPWIPPQQDQAFQQGGMLVFDGTTCVWSHQDPATGAHADLQEVLAVATGGPGSKLTEIKTPAPETSAAAAMQDCGCEQ